MTKDLTHGSPLKVLLLFTIPLALGNLFQQFYSLADTIIVGRFVGVGALAAVGSTSAVNYLVLGFVIGLCNGFAIPIAQLFGAKDFSGMRRHVSNAVWLCCLWGAVLTVLTVVLTRPIMELMQTPIDIIDDASTYIGWIFAGIPFVFLYNMVAAIMRALGDSRTPLFFLLLTSVLNIFLDLLLILGFDLGVTGAAVATDAAQAVSGVLSTIYLICKFDVLKLQPGEGRLQYGVCRRLSAMGIPFGLQCTITAIGSVVMQSAVNVLGSTAVAAVTAAGKTNNLLTVPYESLGTAMATYAGQNLGAARLDRVNQGVNRGLGICVVYSAASMALIYLFDRSVFSLFLETNTATEIFDAAHQYLVWNGWFYLLLGALIVWRYAIQGLGYSTLAMMAGVAEMIARTLVALALVPVLGYFGACLANPAAWIAACLFLFPAYRWTLRHLENLLQAGRLRVQISNG
ncbi:MAG: MATE family efflux transporter [Gemmiger sp.]